MAVSVNKRALKILEGMLSEEDALGIKSFRSKCGATVVDCGVKAPGSCRAGIYVAEICLGGLASISLTLKAYGDLTLPAIEEAVDFPAIACMCSQYAGWRIAFKGFRGLGSGPARALALKPRKLFEKIGYRDSSDEAVLVLEADEYPPDGALAAIAEVCHVDPENLYVLVAPTNSVVGSIQVSCRVVETGIHRLDVLGFDVKRVEQGLGRCPVAPLHPDPTIMMGLANDALIYAGEVFLTVSFQDDSELASLVREASSTTSPSYGKPFYEIYREAGFDFYRIDPRIFAPASITVLNRASGRVFRSGRVDAGLLANFWERYLS